MIAAAKEIVIINGRTILKENRGTIELENKWCESITKRIGFVKRNATTPKPIIVLALISEIGHTFYHNIHIMIKAHEISPEMVINLDQTSLPFIVISKYTLEEKGTSRVSVPDTADYCLITGTFDITLAGSEVSPNINQINFMLPRHLIIGLIKNCFP